VDDARFVDGRPAVLGFSRGARQRFLTDDMFAAAGRGTAYPSQCRWWESRMSMNIDGRIVHDAAPVTSGRLCRSEPAPLLGETGRFASAKEPCGPGWRARAKKRTRQWWHTLGECALAHEAPPIRATFNFLHSWDPSCTSCAVSGGRIPLDEFYWSL